MADDLLDALQTRAAKVQDVDETTGIVEVRIIPYEVEAELASGYYEIFTTGAFAAACGNPSRCKMSDQNHNHDNILGKALELRSKDDAMEGTVLIPPTGRGKDVLTLMQAGVLDEISAEFMPQPRHRQITKRSDGLHVRHNKATLLGLSPVAAGAYGQDARVMSVRQAQQNLDKERELAYLATLTAGRR